MLAQTPTLRLHDFVPSGCFWHLARVQERAGDGGQLHTHDFSEVFWIEAGDGVHLINNQRRLLKPGTLVLIRPSDIHGFRAHGEQGFTLVNLAFSTGGLDQIKHRYFSSEAWPWSDDAMPCVYNLNAEQMAWLRGQTHRLATARQGALVLDRFLLNLLGELSEPPPPIFEQALPEWLDQAFRQLRNDPRALARGAPALARLAHRSHEHISRVVRQTTGQTTTELINRIRMERAALDLRMSSKPILDVALDCGIGNLSHFYRLFSRFFAQTPRQYRLHQQMLVRSNAQVDEFRDSSARTPG